METRTTCRIKSFLFLTVFVICLTTNNSFAFQNNSSIYFSLDDCVANFFTGSNKIYTEFEPDINIDVDGPTVTMVTGYMYRENPEDNPHSCTEGVEGSKAICFGASPSCEFDPENDKPVIFDFEIDPSDNCSASFSNFKFYEQGIPTFNWIDGASGPNNQPMYYSVSIFKDDVLIFSMNDIPTSEDWSEEFYDFSDNEMFTVFEKSNFRIELSAYCPVDNDAPLSVWDIDEITISTVTNEVGAATLDGGPFEFCVGDGTADNIAEGAITVSGGIGESSQWVITDADLNILGLPGNITDADFDGAGGGTCLIWYLTYNGELSGAEMGANAGDLQGCFALSNSINVVRNEVGAATLDGGPFEFCVGDGTADNIAEGAITVSGGIGESSQWVITDADLNILGLPGNITDADFDGAGGGTCLIWYLTYNGELTGAEMGANAGDLQGCFALSNSINVVRNEVGAATLDGGPFEFCVGDGTADNIAEGAITVSGGIGESSQWVITDADLNILGLPGNITDADFDGAGGGTCLIWYLTYNGELSGAEMGANAGDLQGCFALSNSINVVRNEVGAATLDGGPFEFCVGDGTADNIAEGAITVSGGIGESSQWVITDADLNILGLPGNITDADFDGAGGGTCLIWYLTYNGELSGAEMGANAGDLQGCFALSNSINVVRNEVGAATLDGGPFEFCVGDGTADNIAEGAITVSGGIGESSQWVITDADLNILGLPGNITDADFDGAGGGTCLIWYLTYNGELTGAEMGANAGDLQGCFALSNSINVVRNEVGAATLDGGPFEFCVGDGTADNIAEGAITVSGGIGESSQWVITDADLNILGLPGNITDADFDGAGGGTCLIWYLTYNGELTGAEMGANAGDLQGCFALSNSINVVRNEVGAATLDGGPFEFCVGDGTADNIAEGAITVSGGIGESSQWVITDADLNILGLPGNITDADFDGAGGGTCLIWYLTYNGELTGAEMGANAGDLQGCFALSNSINVVRNEVGAATLDGGPFEFCVGDGTADNIEEGAITVSGGIGESSQWVITDADLNILGLPGNITDADFDGAGGGTCLIWYLTYNGELTGAEMGANAGDLQGCFALSNSINVVRNEVGAATLDGGPFEFCVGDGTADNIAEGAITVSGGIGESSQWVITDADLNILGLPGNITDADFDGAGGGTCLIWYLTYNGELTGAEMGANAGDLQGCFALSNSINVVRNEVGAATLDGGPFEFCVGDGTADNIAEGAITVSGGIGESSQWVITDADLNILGLPGNITDADFDGAGGGTCLIWYLTYNGELTGAEMGANAGDLQGCFALSNSINVVRNEVGAATLDGGPFEFCVGDGTADNIAEGAITVSGGIGESSQWVITDADLNILGLPGNITDADFDGAGGGTCLIWYLTYNGELTGAEMGANAGDLQGCFALSNSINVVRNEVGAATLDGGPFEFCVGDGTADNIEEGAITVSGGIGESSQWVITDADLNILGLPGNITDADFDGAGGGTCLIWYLTYNGELSGAEMGANAGDLQGCFALSNSINVVRNEVGAATLDGGPFEFCVGDGTADNIAEGAITVSGGIGESSQWVITDADLNILGLPGNITDADFDGAGGGTCLIWYLTYNGELTGAEMGANAGDLQGCFALSNSINVVRNEVGAATLDGGPFEFCVGDGTADNIAEGAITVSGGIGESSQWVITDADLNILGLPGNITDADFDGAGGGTCLIWYLTYNGELTGAEMGANAGDLQGCFALSNSINVVRNEVGAATLDGGPFEFCVGDGTADNIEEGAITVSGGIGESSQWVITDADLNILGLPGNITDADFDGSGGGTCLIWYLTYNGELTGAEMGANAGDLQGCFALSNSINVVRNEVGAATLDGGPFEFCVGDGTADNIEEGAITVSGGIGESSQWVITDADLNILGLPGNITDADFDGSGGGTCLIWYLTYNGELTGAEMGANAGDLQGCFALSNSINVVRNEVGAATLDGGPFEFCVGDGTADNIEEGAITVSGGIGESSQWVITDADLNILGLPGNITDADFDGSGGGTCLIWYLTYNGELTGAEMGANAGDLQGCFALSNSINVVRNEVGAATLDGGPFEFCVGDGTADNIEEGAITVSGGIGESSQWVITDADLNILGLPGNITDADFDGAGGGTCLIWYLTYNGELTGAEMGANAGDLQGCFALSNSINVVRNEVGAATLDGGPFEFCVGDGTADNIAEGAITVSGGIGESSQWVITDADLNILGLPGNITDADFDGAGGGTCLIWYLTYNGELTGAEMGANAGDLQGCFALSNSINVVRNEVGAATLDGGPFEFCVGDGTADNIAEGAITVSGGIGESSQWVITDADLNILGLPGNITDADFDGAGGGTCLIWYLTYNGELTGAEMGANAGDLQGCFALSNSINVVRNEVGAATLDGGPFEFCVGDGTADNIAEGAITVSGGIGESSQWVITDADLNILGLPGNITDADFDGAGGGTCLIWYLTYNGELTGAEMGANAGDLQGCFALSNSITVVRNEVGAATLDGGPFEFCVGDGTADNIAEGAITVSGGIGESSQWVITDADLNILGLPGNITDADFDGAGGGTCLIWYLTYNGELSGAEMGANAGDLQGCFALSNSINVVRNEVGAATLDGGPFEFSVGDGEEDLIPEGAITLTEGIGENTQWVITNENLKILSLPDDITTINFDESEEGTCLIWYLTYNGEISGLTQNANAGNLQGCFALSNNIVVVRNELIPAILGGGPFEFCVGDGIPDIIEDGAITIIAGQGESNQWVVTDDQLNILGLPDNYSDVNFDLNGSGICLVSNVTYFGEISGLVVGNNTGDLEGYYSFSNSVSVVRYNPEPAVLIGGPFEFCVGDGVSDNIMDDEILVSDGIGKNSQWIITDENLNILGLPNDYTDVDFDVVEPGNCLIWYITYSGNISGLEIGANAGDLVGCYALSNSIAVDRLDCSMMGIGAINEINFNGDVEILNIGNDTLDLTDFYLCQFPVYQKVSDLTIVCGSEFKLAPGEFLTVASNLELSRTDGEIGLYSAGSNFGSSDLIEDYVEWGSAGHQRSSVATQAGIWTTGDFVAAVSGTNSLLYDGAGDASSDWSEGTSTPCAANAQDPSRNNILQIRTFPNPARDIINLELSNYSHETFNVRVLNFQGSVVMEKLNQNHNFTRLDIKNLVPGNYIILVSGIGVYKAKKIIVLK